MCLRANNSNVPDEVFSLCDINIKDMTENTSALVGRAARPRRAHEVLNIGSESVETTTRYDSTSGSCSSTLDVDIGGTRTGARAGGGACAPAEETAVADVSSSSLSSPPSVEKSEWEEWATPITVGRSDWVVGTENARWGLAVQRGCGTPRP